jgi:hypothetical protein
MVAGSFRLPVAGGAVVGGPELLEGATPAVTRALLEEDLGVLLVVMALAEEHPARATTALAAITAVRGNRPLDGARRRSR